MVRLKPKAQGPAARTPRGRGRRVPAEAPPPVETAAAHEPLHEPMHDAAADPVVDTLPDESRPATKRPRRKRS